ncbi:unnamed protein product [Paramecium pentaurelia]|uniref:ADP-ribosylation factor n=1 Tax=Paramecium pentaurelia TaxID=43138 RepID=A0A8S1UWA6_9CILI|nr:unnamed protein product [Paramecium pentaurelia]
MGSLFTKLYSSLFNKKQIRLIMIGLDAVGKTTILYRLNLNQELKAPIPTIGFNVEKINFQNIQFTCFDIGGGYKIRLLWKQYIEEGTGIIFIIDSSDPNRLPEAKQELMRFLNENETKGAPLLVLANKQDIAKFTVDELKQFLDLPYQNRQCYIQPCCAKTGEGLYEGLSWLTRIYNSK